MRYPTAHAVACLWLAATLLLPGCSTPETEDRERADHLTALRQALAAGTADPTNLWQDSRWQALRADPAQRSGLARLLRDHPVTHTTIATAATPGERLTFSGRILAAGGEPLAGALMRLYHADATGRYSPEAGEPGAGERNPLHFAWLTTDATGHFTVSTILPGGYGGAPPHFHFTMARSRNGAGPRQGGAIYFEGDWPMPTEVYDDARSGHAIVSPITTAADGTVEARADLRFRP